MKTYAPKTIDALRMAFPTDVTDLMPARADIPSDFWEDRGEARPWVRFQRDWFFRGLPKGTKIQTKPGIDLRTALGHLKTIQASWDPPHEYKEAAVAYLASLWFVSPPGGVS